MDSRIRGGSDMHGKLGNGKQVTSEVLNVLRGGEHISESWNEINNDQLWAMTKLGGSCGG